MTGRVGAGAWVVLCMGLPPSLLFLAKLRILGLWLASATLSGLGLMGCAILGGWLVYISALRGLGQVSAVYPRLSLGKRSRVTFAGVYSAVLFLSGLGGFLVYLEG